MICLLLRCQCLGSQHCRGYPKEASQLPEGKHSDIHHQADCTCLRRNHPRSRLPGQVYGGIHHTDGQHCIRCLRCAYLGNFPDGRRVPWANKYGAPAGLATSLAFNLWVSLGAMLQGIPIKALPSIGTEGCSRWLGAENSTILTQGELHCEYSSIAHDDDDHRQQP